MRISKMMEKTVNTSSLLALLIIMFQGSASGQTQDEIYPFPLLSLEDYNISKPNRNEIEASLRRSMPSGIHTYQNHLTESIHLRDDTRCYSSSSNRLEERTLEAVYFNCSDSLREYATHRRGNEATHDYLYGEDENRILHANIEHSYWNICWQRELRGDVGSPDRGYYITEPIPLVDPNDSERFAYYSMNLVLPRMGPELYLVSCAVHPELAMRQIISGQFNNIPVETAIAQANEPATDIETAGSVQSPQVIYINFDMTDNARFDCSRGIANGRPGCPVNGLMLETNGYNFRMLAESLTRNSDGTYKDPVLFDYYMEIYRRPELRSQIIANVLDTLNESFSGMNIRFVTDTRSRDVLIYSTVYISTERDLDLLHEVAISLDKDQSTVFVSQAERIKRVFYGEHSSSAAIHGISSQATENTADFGNSVIDDTAFVFPLALNPDGSYSQLNPDELAITIAHEVGHLLGLSHENPTEQRFIMETDNGFPRQQQFSPSNINTLRENLGVRR